ncbi:MAG: hypothetical protein ACOH17_07225 [Cellulomonas sp.]
MAVLALTAPPAILGSLTGISDFPLAVVRTTAADNGDGTWTVTAETEETNISALQSLGCVVLTVVSDADQLALWQTIDTQIDDEPPVA